MTSDKLLKEGIAAFKAGRKKEARELFFQIIELDRGNEQAWLWLSGAVDTDDERRACLEEVLALNPANAVARRGLEHLQALDPQPQALDPQPAAPVEPKPIVPLTPKAPPPPEPLPGLDATLAPPLSADPSAPLSAAPSAPLSVTPAPGGPEGPAPVTEKEAKKGGIDWVMVVGGVALLGVICVVACALLAYLGATQGQESASPTASPAQITSVVYENIAAHNAEDIDRYMATIHPKSPGYDETKKMLGEMYQQFELKHTVTGVELLKVSGDRAEVSFTLTTRKVRGPAFRDNRIVGVFNLRQDDDGRWKLWGLDVDDIVYLE
jgi:ketosteroid isomerase-like protein